jgi:hypothetical protein
MAVLSESPELRNCALRATFLRIETAPARFYHGTRRTIIYPQDSFRIAADRSVLT